MTMIVWLVITSLYTEYIIINIETLLVSNDNLICIYSLGWTSSSCANICVCTVQVFNTTTQLTNSSRSKVPYTGGVESHQNTPISKLITPIRRKK